jgi:hypothetical protein
MEWYCTYNIVSNNGVVIESIIEGIFKYPGKLHAWGTIAIGSFLTTKKQISP